MIDPSFSYSITSSLVLLQTSTVTKKTKVMIFYRILKFNCISKCKC